MICLGHFFAYFCIALKKDTAIPRSLSAPESSGVASGPKEGATLDVQGASRGRGLLVWLCVIPPCWVAWG